MVSNLVRIHHAQYQQDLPFWIERTAGLNPVLEIGCGHGRVTLPLAEAGRTMVGVDQDFTSLAYLSAVMKTLDEEIHQSVRLINANILAFRSGILFEGVIIPCNTYSTFSAEDRARLLRVIQASLKGGGELIISLPNPRRTNAIHADLGAEKEMEPPDPEAVITHPETGFPVQISSRLRTTKNSILWDWIYDHLHPSGQVERAVITVEHYLFSQAEILTELEQEGFLDVHCLGNFSGDRFHKDSPYLILSCKK